MAERAKRRGERSMSLVREMVRAEMSGVKFEVKMGMRRGVRNQRMMRMTERPRAAQLKMAEAKRWACLSFCFSKKGVRRGMKETVMTPMTRRLKMRSGILKAAK